MYFSFFFKEFLHIKIVDQTVEPGALKQMMWSPQLRALKFSSRGPRALHILGRSPGALNPFGTLNNHNATDMQLIPLELVKSNRDSVRKAREAYLIERDQTLQPRGLNKKDETFSKQ